MKSHKKDKMSPLSLPFSIFKLHPKALLLEWNQKPSRKLLFEIITFKAELEIKLEGVSQITMGYHSLLIEWNVKVLSKNFMYSTLSIIYFSIDYTKPTYNRHWKIPVCYEDEFAQDLERLSQELYLSPQQVIEIHSRGIYWVYFIGFLPGFLYLEGLDSKLFFPRKNRPVLKVPKGSVAIGGNQTGIYPNLSPGGWHIIGKTPVALFDPKKKPYCFAKSGDTLSFEAISKMEFENIEKKITEGSFTLA
jgi:inhibitor of KinA